MRCPTDRWLRGAVVELGLIIYMSGTAGAAAFTAGNVVVYRVGNGVASLVNTGNPVFLDEFTPGGMLVQSIALPVTASGSTHSLVADGTATDEGQLGSSTDGQYLLLTGYDATLLGTTPLAGSKTIARTVGRVKYNGTIDTSTALTDFSSGDSPRSATSTDGNDLWIGGAKGGVRYATLGDTTSVQLSTDESEIRAVGIFDEQLYISTQSKSIRIGAVGAGLPTTAGQDIISLPGFATTGHPDAFFFADLDPAMPGVDTLYMADDSAGLEKFSLLSGKWFSNGTAGVGSDAYRGITGTVNGTTVTLYATRKGGGAAGGGELVRLVDSSGFSGSFSGTPTLVSSAAAKEAFRGVAMVPAAAGPPTTNTPTRTPTVLPPTPTLTAPPPTPTASSPPATATATATAVLVATGTAAATATATASGTAVNTPVATSTVKGTAPPTAAAGEFTAGNLVVYRVGDGVDTLANTGNPVFLDEYTPQGVATGVSVALPTTAEGTNQALVASGTAASEGQLSRSADGQYLILTGYASTLPAAASLSSTTAAAVPRVIGRVKYDGSIDTSTALTDFSDGSNPRSATSTNGTDLWGVGNGGGVRYATLSSTTSTQLNSDSVNNRYVAIFGGQLYISSQKLSVRIAAVGSGTPTIAGQAATSLPGFPTTGAPEAFFFAAVPGGMVLYVADDAAGIEKFSLVSGSWVANGTAGVGADLYNGLTGTVDGGSVTLYATRKAGEIASLVDSSGFNATLSGSPALVAAAGANEAFRGLALAPQGPGPPPPTNTPLATPSGTPPTVTASPTAAPTRTATPVPPATSTATAGATGNPTVSPTVAANGFTPGDVVVYRIGDGAAALTDNGNAVFVDEYTTAGTLVQSVALPTTANGVQQPLVATTDVSEGILARSTDKQYILFTGYGADLSGGMPLFMTAAATVPRVVGRVRYDGTIDTSTALSDVSDANNPRSATSTNGTDLWVGGAGKSTGGVHYATLGSTTSTQLFASIPKGVRQAGIFGGQLYFDSNATGFLNISTVGTGLPTTGGQSGTELPGLPDSNGNDGFVFVDLGDGMGLGTLYVANDSAGAVEKYALLGGTWTAEGSIAAAGAHGVAATVDATIHAVTLYITGTSGSDGTLFSFTDTSGFGAMASGSAATLATAGANQAFRGVALAPEGSGPPPPTNTPAPSSGPQPTATATLVTQPSHTATRAATAQPTGTTHPTNAPGSTATPTVAASQCIGDCDGNGTVEVNELLIGVNILLGNASLDRCPSFDCERTGEVPVACLIQGVNAILDGCPAS